MARTRGKQYRRYAEKDLQLAVSEVMGTTSTKRHTSLSAIADKYGIPRTTLRGHAAAKGAVHSPGDSTVLSAENEAILAAWLKKRNDDMRPPNIPTFQAKVGEILGLQNAARLELCYFTVDGQPSLEPSPQWVERFAQRHKFGFTEYTLSQQRALGLLEEYSTDDDTTNSKQQQQQQQAPFTHHAASHYDGHDHHTRACTRHQRADATTAATSQQQPGPGSPAANLVNWTEQKLIDHLKQQEKEWPDEKLQDIIERKDVDEMARYLNTGLPGVPEMPFDRGLIEAWLEGEAAHRHASHGTHHHPQQRQKQQKVQRNKKAPVAGGFKQQQQKVQHSKRAPVLGHTKRPGETQANNNSSSSDKEAPVVGGIKRRGPSPATTTSHNKASSVKPAKRAKSSNTKWKPVTPHECAALLIEGAKELQAELQAEAAAKAKQGSKAAA